MNRIIRIGSRDSKLAVTQSEIIKRQIEQNHPEIKVEIITMKTTGDMILDKSLDAIGGKGLFVKELDKALLEDRIDISVHSLKDMPMETWAELPILAYSKREDPRDALIFKPGTDEIPEGGIIGSSSKRRALQVQKLYPRCTFLGIRGNVQTRLRKLSQENYDGTILAAAGLRRLGMKEYIGRIFSTEEVLPAAGQGILAVQGRQGEYMNFLEGIDHRESRIAAMAERAYVRALDGGCSSPVAAYGEVYGNELRLTGLYYEESSNQYGIGTTLGDADKAQELGEYLAETMRAQGV